MKYHLCYQLKIAHILEELSFVQSKLGLTLRMDVMTQCVSTLQASALTMFLTDGPIFSHKLKILACFSPV